MAIGGEALVIFMCQDDPNFTDVGFLFITTSILPSRVETMDLSRDINFTCRHNRPIVRYELRIVDITNLSQKGQQMGLAPALIHC